MKYLSLLNKMVLMSVSILFINACHNEEHDEETVITSDIVGNWKVISFEDYETSVVITKSIDNTWTQFNNGDITLSFTEKDLTNGIILGRKVTNGFSGKYLITTNREIKISNFIQTMINEPEWGRLFNSIIYAETYEVNNERLIIFYNQGKNSITLERFD
jgi:hypothetical protein